MPSVVGLNWQQATVTLIQAGITPNDGQVVGNANNIGYFQPWPVVLDFVNLPATQPGYVTAQFPVAGTANVPFGATVNLQVSNFPLAFANVDSGLYGNNGIFTNVHGPSLLQESGGYLLLENGAGVILLG